MKVLCIDDTLCEFLKYWGVYTVFKEGFYMGERVYYIEECRHLFSDPLFKAKRFIPLSDIDETEFERNYKKELV